jgi:type IV pilus assembly protein PilM
MRVRRSFVGIDINATGLTFAALQRERSSFQLSGVRQESLEGVFEFSSQRPNVLDARRFVEALQRGVDLLARNGEQIALSLPDRVGRIYLTEVEMPFKSHQEGVDILKWSLKNSLPADPSQVKLDFQILEKYEDGRRRCLAAAIALPVLEQYEQLVSEAGLRAVMVDFHSLNLYNYYHYRLELGEEFVLVGMETDRMSVQYFSGRALAYQRVREGSLGRDRLFRELNRTLAEAQASFPAILRCAVYVHLDTDLDDEMQALLSASFEREVKILDPQFKRLLGVETSNNLPPGGALAAATAAAESLM